MLIGHDESQNVLTLAPSLGYLKLSTLAALPCSLFRPKSPYTKKAPDISEGGV